MTVEAIAREIDPAAFDHLATMNSYWRLRWDNAMAAARRVAVLIENPEGRVMPAENIALRAPAADLERALAYYRNLPSLGNGTILTEAIDRMISR